MTTIPIPATNLYFAVLPKPVTRGRAKAEELRHAFEPSIPGGFDGVLPVYRPLPDGRVLAIGVPSAAIGALPPGTVAAHPASWPDELAPEIGAIPPEGINILIDAAEPHTVRCERARAQIHVAIALAVVTAFAVLLLHQQGLRHHEHTKLLLEEASRVQLEALGPTATSSRQPPASLMTSELRKLRATRSDAAGASEVGGGTQADVALATLLGRWPSEAEAQAESISVAPRTIEVVVTVPTLSHAEILMAALRTVPGTTFGGETTRQDRDRVRVTVRLNRGWDG